MTAIPCGQKKRTSEIIQSQTVTPPLAAMEGTTLRLKTATTKRRTRSQRPRTRLRCGASSGSTTCRAVVMTSFANLTLSYVPGDRASVPGGSNVRDTAFSLRLGQGRSDLVKHRQVLVDVRFGVLHGDGPLLVPPIRLRQNAAIDHSEPVVPPQVDVNLGPVAVIADFLRIEHQRAI